MKLKWNKGDITTKMAYGGTRNGNVPIYGDTGAHCPDYVEGHRFVGEEAEKLMFFFGKEMNDENEKGMIRFEFKNEPPEVKLMVKAYDKKNIDKYVNTWLFLLHDLKLYVFTNKELNCVKDILKKLKLSANLLPIKPKKAGSFVRVFGRRQEDIDMLIRACENPDPLGESLVANGLSAGGQIHPRSGRTGKNQRSSGSFHSYSPRTKLEFNTYEGLHVKVYQDAITKLKVDAIVNAANDKLVNIGGVALVISKAAGRDMDTECKEKMKKHGHYGIPDGDNEVTGAGRLPYKGIIHAVGPRWHAYTDKRECLRTLQKTIVNILEAGKRKNFTTIAMPPISSGIFGVPKLMCAAMYLKGIFDFSGHFGLGSLKEFHIIDIQDDVLDMVVDWYNEFKADPFCLEYNSVLKTSPHYNKGNNKAFRNNDQADKIVRNRVGSASGFSGSVKGNDKFKSMYDHKGHEIKAPSMETVDGGKRFCSKRFCGKTDIYIYSIDVLTLKGIDVIAVSEDPMVTGSGALSRVLLDAGDSKYRNEHAKLKRWLYRSHSAATVMLTIGGDNLPFHHVIHAVIRRSGESNEDVFQTKLQNTITKVLETANSLVVKTKKRNIPGIKLALPVMGLGTQRDNNTLCKCCWTTTEAIKKFLQTTGYVKIEEIHLINLDDFITKVLQECFTTNPSYRPPPPAKPDMTSTYNKQAQAYLRHKIETWKMDPRAQRNTDVSRFMKSKKIPGNLQIYGMDTEDNNENCVVCLCEFDDPVELIDCKHLFCKECIVEVFGSNPSCPVCGTVYGMVYGDQPRDGVANVYEEEESLPGYAKKKTYTIYYEFPNGKQEEFHPEPGKPYDRMAVTGFLPKTLEGTEVLGLLKKAFEQGLTFAIRTSRTTGKEGVLTWNDIHHKTSRTGGPQKFGYPDPEYLSRVKDELSCKGITVDK